MKLLEVGDKVQTTSELKVGELILAAGLKGTVTRAQMTYNPWVQSDPVEPNMQSLTVELQVLPGIKTIKWFQGQNGIERC